MILIIVIMGVLILTFFAIGLIRLIDWRAFFVRRYGHDYKKGLAHIIVNGVGVYRQSTMIHEGTDAMTYQRQSVIASEKKYVYDIVPHKDKNGNDIPMDYDEYTGYRLYRVEPGGSIGYPDRFNAPVVDYPEELISAHILDRTVIDYCASVNIDKEMNWKPLLIGGIVLIIVVIAGLFLFGVIKAPDASINDQAKTTANVTQVTQEETNKTPEIITGPVEAGK